MSQSNSARIALTAAIAAVSSITISTSQAAVLEEIIVTAQKRAQSLQDVPISVSAVSGQKIQEAGIYTMTALASQVPNLNIGEGPVNTNIYMRGVGSGNNQAFEQSVGMYIDGVYMGRGRQYRSPFLDLERVEVLRGPQGTLFGKNTVAGAINVITANPEVGEAFNGSIAAVLETNSGNVLEGVLSGGLGESTAARLAFKYRETDGHITNTFLDQQEPQVEESLFRFTGVWQVNDDIDVNLKYSHSDYKRVGQLSLVNNYLTPAEVAADFPNASAFAQTAYAVTNMFYPELASIAGQEFTAFRDNGYGPDKSSLSIGNNPDSSNNKTDNVVATVNVVLGEHTLTSITGYSSYEYVDGADVDWLPLSFISRDDDQQFDQLSQEFRIASPVGETFEYIGGLYYEEQKMEFDRRVMIDASFGGLFDDFNTNISNPPIASLFTALTGGGYNALIAARNHHYELDAKSFALFGQGTFNISDEFRLTLGLRYTKEDKDVVSNQFLSDSDTGFNTPSFNPYLVGIQASSFNAYNRRYNADRSTSKWIPSANVQWDISENSMLYFTVSEGFKSGGFSSADDQRPSDAGVATNPNCAVTYCTVPGDDFEFQDEEVLAYELGGKHKLFDGAMTANWALFRTEYTDQQVSVFKGVGFAVTNAAQSLIQGLEMDLRWQAHDDLFIGLSAAYLDAEYESYRDGPCTAKQIDTLGSACGTNGENDLSGHETTFAPKYTGALFFDYTKALTEQVTFFFSGDINYSAEFSTAGDADTQDYQESYTKLGLRTGLRSSDDSWEVMFFGRNITDEEVALLRFDVPVLVGSHASTVDEGRVLGMRASYRF